MHYTQRLEDLRKDKDLTQEQVAEQLGLKREQYRRYETGINEIKASFIIKVCKFYNVSADYLLGFTDTYKTLPKN
ncbi:MAG: helix-turn-helix domain-containing protein [Oscillospiraceae bacterium]|nr:helix-turn-helix domain-containing protein [Oscillospiraceae bacterium]